MAIENHLRRVMCLFLMKTVISLVFAPDLETFNHLAVLSHKHEITFAYCVNVCTL